MYTLFILDHEYLASNLLSVSQDLSKRIQLCKYAFRTPILYCRNRMNKMELRKNEMASLTFICSNSYFEDALGVVCRLRYNIFVAHIIRLQIYVSFYLISDTVIRSIFNILLDIHIKKTEILRTLRKSFNLNHLRNMIGICFMKY